MPERLSRSGCQLVICCPAKQCITAEVLNVTRQRMLLSSRPFHEEGVNVIIVGSTSASRASKLP